MQRLNKEYKLQINDSINLVYGSINRTDPQVVYLSGKTWVKPKEKGEYDKVINNILSNFKRLCRKNIFNSVFISKKYICNFDLNTLALNEGKHTFLSFDLFVKQTEKPFKDLKSFKPFINDLFSNAINQLEIDFAENNFNLSKSKQK